MSDIQTFVNRLLAQEPAAPYTIQLEIDTDGDVAALFEVLLTIMTSVLKAWYPPPISITQLTEGDLRKLQAYFASFGIAFELVIEPVPRVLRINNREYERQTRLEDMRFQMTSGDNLYTAKFAFLT